MSALAVNVLQGLLSVWPEYSTAHSSRMNGHKLV